MSTAPGNPTPSASRGRRNPGPDTTPAGRKHLLTVVVEDYFHHVGFTHVVRPDRWRRFEARVEDNTGRALDLLDAHDVRATFFVLGWVADKVPGVVREIVRRGHEVASKGYHHRTVREMGPGEFREDLLRSREAIERAAGVKVLGYRVARGSIAPDDVWALDVLAEEGFAYDSSLFPRLGDIAGEPWRRLPHEHVWRDRRLWEIPLTSVGPSWLSVPVAGGNYLRQSPEWLMQQVFADWDRKHREPFNLYFHVWELDPELPRIEAGWMAHVRQYRNVERMPGRIEEYLRRYRFQPIADYLGLKRDLPPEPPRPPRKAAKAVVPEAAPRAELVPVTVVVPAYNEELAIPYLANTLKEVAEDLGRRYELRWIFVDDGSGDRTWESLRKHFAAWPRTSFVRHTTNRGVAQAILTGIQAATTEVVCSIDCDCTYDPRQLADMIPQLQGDVAMVTASPYHKEGRVLNVPAWRLSLSKGLSFLYRRVLNNRLATYTACFRVYRRSAVADLKLHHGGFLGVAETLARLDLGGAEVIEQPAVLEVRILGYSKMKILKTVRGHLGLLLEVATERWLGREG